MKRIATVILIAFGTSTCTPVYAEQGVGFTLGTGQQIDADIKYCRDANTKLQKKNNTLEESARQADDEIAQLKTKSNTLSSDLNLALKAKDQYKDLYTKADDARLKAIANAPSRTTWALVGASVTAVLGGIAAVYLRR